MKSKYFKVKELVPLSLYNMLHEDALWELMNDDLIESIDKIKEVFSKGTIVINSYAWNGERTQSGIRTKNSKYYSEGSQHSKGKAVDMVFSNYTADEVREYILSNPDEFPKVGGIELGVEWVHLDCRKRVNGKIITFYP